VMRGRVMALYLAIFLGGTPIGAPIVGLVANEFGPRWALGLAGISGIVAAVVGIAWIMVSKNLRVSIVRRRIKVVPRGDKRARAEEELALDETVARRA